MKKERKNEQTNEQNGIEWKEEEEGEAEKEPQFSFLMRQYDRRQIQRETEREKFQRQNK